MLKTVETFLNPIQAHILRGRLESEDILAFVSHEHHIWAKWSLSHALGGVKVQVASTNYEEAMLVISEINAGKYQDLLEDAGQEDVICKYCESNSVVPQDWPWKISIVLSFLLMPLPYTTKLVKCENCRKTWIANEERPYPLISIGLVLIATYFFIGLVVTSGYHLCKVNQLSKACM